MSIVVPLLIALPLVGFLLIALLCPSPRLAGLAATAIVTGTFVLTLAGLASLLGLPAEERSVRPLLWRWITVESFAADVRLLYDPLSAWMAVIVTSIGALVHAYSLSYMEGDRGYRRYFATLNLFIAAMLLLVLADNYLLLLVGWAGVGLSSYLLIGHWREREGVPAAATKAFVLNTLGDIGLMLALFVLVTEVGDVTYARVFEAAPRLGSDTATLICAGLLVASAAKSAQAPMQVWLPDAMAGPTPVSALIHAATMVTAGVYLLARSAPLLVASPVAMGLVAAIGAATALIGALAATSQTNIKRVLAYSTISQLGYMFLAVGVGAYDAGLFHLWTHALYKACLFLGAGAVIHALHGEEELGRMGGLKRAMPVVYVAMLLGAGALAGIPPLSGFWSKDEVLAAAFFAPRGNWVLGVLGLVTSTLTGYYAARLLLLTFHGQPRGHAEPHGISRLLWMPVASLGGLSLVGGVVQYVGREGTLSHFLEPTWSGARTYEPHLGGGYWLVSLAAAALALLGAGYALLLHRRGALPVEGRGGARYLREGLGFDRAYALGVVRPSRALGGYLSSTFEGGVIDRSVLGVARSARGAGGALGLLQSGYLRSYALAALTGTVALLLYILLAVS